MRGFVHGKIARIRRGNIGQIWAWQRWLNWAAAQFKRGSVAQIVRPPNLNFTTFTKSGSRQIRMW
jgi:hypothetical protein